MKQFDLEFTLNERKEMLLYMNEIGFFHTPFIMELLLKNQRRIRFNSDKLITYLKYLFREVSIGTKNPKKLKKN
jgi:hypothetical protein